MKIYDIQLLVMVESGNNELLDNKNIFPLGGI
jgi:hypothetical protein